jgi:hypothetical protein
MKVRFNKMIYNSFYPRVHANHACKSSPRSAKMADGTGTSAAQS